MRQPAPGCRLFGWLLRLFPAEFREDFAEEMTMVFDEQRRLTRSSRMQRMRFWAEVVWGMLSTAPARHLENLLRDLRGGMRGMARRPLVAAVSALSLAIGIGAVTTVFSVFQATILHSIPGIRQPEQLVNLHIRSASEETFRLTSYPVYLDLRDAEALTGLAGFNGLALSLSGPTEPEVTASQIVTWNYFPLLGLKPSAGRFFRPEEDEPGQGSVVVVSHWLWQNRLGGGPEAVGSTIRLNGHPFTVIGILPEGFRGHFTGFNFDVFIPSSMSHIAGLDRMDRDAHWLELIGRLREGIPIEEAQGEFSLLTERLTRAYPDSNRSMEVQLEAATGIDQDLRGGLLAFLLILMGISALVLLVACVNVAGMLLARMVERQREMALRLALGAGRGRLARQLLTENLLLALLGGGLGMLSAWWATKLASSALPAFGGVVTLDVQLNATALLWGLIVCIAACLLLGWMPARQAWRAEPAGALQQGDGRGTQGTRLRSLLVTGQIALALVVLISAGLFLRALQQASAIDFGMDPKPIRIASLNPDLASMTDEESRRFFEALIPKVEALPEVDSAALTSRVPLSLGSRFFPNTARLEIPGWIPPSDSTGFRIEHSIVSEGYFETLHIPLLEGRAFSASDRPGAAATAVVNRSFAARFWPGKSALGRQLRLEGKDLAIVGVVGDAKYRTLEEAPLPFLYLPFAQHFPGRGVLLARSRAGVGPEALAQPLRQAIRQAAPDLPIRDFVPMTEHIEVSLLPQRIASAVAGALGLVALLLALVGLYGVVSYSVSRRTREIGVRISLGARPRDVVRLVLRQGLALVLAGTALGIPAAIALARLMERFLIGVSPLDAAAFLSASALLSLVACLAGYLPARRAARIDPVRALKTE